MTTPSIATVLTSSQDVPNGETGVQQGELDHYFEFGDVYETLDACDMLEMKLGQLRHQRVLEHDEWSRIKHELQTIRDTLQNHVNLAVSASRVA